MKASFNKLFLTLCLGLLTLGVAALAPALANAQDTRQIDAWIEDWNYPEARNALEKLRVKGADRPDVQYVYGKYLFHMGDYAGSIEQLESARSKSPSALMFVIDQLLNHVRGTHELVKDYERSVSPNGLFEIRHEKRDAFLMPLAMEALESAYYEVGFALGFWPETPVRVEMYPRANNLAIVSTLPEEAIKTTSTIGLCKYNKLMVTSPRGTVRGYTWLDTLGHEYIHLVISQKTANRVPVWLHEGIAKYFERRWLGEQMSPMAPPREDLLARRIEENNLVSLARMSPSIALLPTQDDATVSYAEVYTLIQFWIEQKGPHAVRHLLDRIAAGLEVEDAFAELSGGTWKSFERRWMRWLKEERPGLRLPVEFDDRLLLVGGQSEDSGEFAGIGVPQARDHLQLGELLRARGHNDGALAEYRRAEVLLGPVHPMVQNGAARVLLEQGKFAEVVEALRGTAQWFPTYYVSYLNLASAYNGLEQYDAALKEASEALAINPFDPRIHEERLRAFEGLGNLPAAAKVREDLSRLQP